MRTVYYPRCMVQLAVVYDGRGAPNTPPLLIEVAPTAATVERNGYHDADTFSVTIPARALAAVDPDLVASMAVAIYMFEAVPGEAREWAVPEFEMVRGLADEPEFTLDENGRTITIPGRDYTGLLLDREWDPRDRIPSGRPLDETIQAIADAAAPPGATARFEVRYESIVAPTPPIVGAAKRSTKKKGAWVKPGKTHWHVIYEMAVAAGFIAFVRGETIYVTDPRTQTEASAAAAPAVVYGRNLGTLSMKRKLAKEKVPQIACAAYDPVARKRVEAFYPPRVSEKKDAVGIKKGEVLRITAPAGVTDRETLQRIARTRHELMARGESAYKATTRHLEGVDGQSLLKLDAGMAVWFRFDPYNRESMRTLSEGERRAHLLAQGFSEQVAVFVAAYFDRLEQFAQPYYTRSATFDYDAENGIDIAIEAVNYACETRELAAAAATSGASAPDASGGPPV